MRAEVKTEAAKLELIRIKRVHSHPDRSDGDSEVKKTEARIDEWRRELAPTAALRKWFGDDPRKWGEFRRRYRNQLKGRGKLEAL